MPKRLPVILSIAAAAIATLFIAPRGLQAGPPPTVADKAVVETVDPIFHRGAVEIQVATGVEFSQQATDFERPNIDYAPTVVRLGYMVDSPHTGGSFLRGNDEFLFEAIGAGIFQGPGTAFGGLSILYRRNFLAPGARLVPYVTIGGGAVYCDAYHDRVQQALGSNFEFDLQTDVGIRYRISTHLTLDTEVAYRHLSNAHLVERNLGTNGIGGLVGLSYTF